MGLRLAHNFLVYTLTIAAFFIGSLVTLFFVPFAKNKALPFQIAAHLWAKFVLFFARIKVSTRGLENIPKDLAVIIVANHQGAADIPVVLAGLPICFRFAIKKELFHVPFFGWYLRQAGYFPIDRKMFRSAYKMVENIVEIIKSGESVLIFPEGTRSFDGTLGEFKRGSLLAALKSGASILPLAISGSYQILPRGSKLFKPAEVKLSAGKPIYIKTEAEYEHKVEEVKEVIAKLL